MCCPASAERKAREISKSVSPDGFTLTEVLVVMVIIGILATGVVFMFSDPTAKVKAAAFEMRGDFNLARGEAVKDNQEVRVDFDPAADSYRIWLDDYDANGVVAPPPPDNDYTPDNPATPAKDGDTLVKEVVFRNRIQYYEFTGAPPANGPPDDPLGNSLTAGNGITLGSTTLTFRPDGTCDSEGSVVVYYPSRDNFDIIKGDPYAIVVDNMATGRVIIQRWRRDQGLWSSK